jgi:thioredoxin-related protein
MSQWFSMTNNRLFLSPFYHLLVLAVTCSGALSLTSARADDAPWKTSFAQAVAEASQQNKQILLNFTGSDWCPPCRKMDQEVLSQKQFSEFASKNLILVKLDFPRHKKLSADEKAQNDQLAKKYAIQGFPTFVLVDSSGKEVRRQEGYLEGGPAEFLKWAKGQN